MSEGSTASAESTESPPSTDDNTSWYPCKPPPMSEEEVSSSASAALQKGKIQELQDPKSGIHLPHPCFSTGDLKYTPTLWWSGNIKKEKKEACRRQTIKGVEVRDLGSDHVLCGEKGLFATEKFSMCDIIGEYTGRVVDDTVNGHYVAALEDKGHDESLGIDAANCGNELRFINSYIGIAFSPNVTMRTAYVNTYPHIVIVCLRDIEEGEEFLLDYGKAYTDAYLTPKPKAPSLAMEVVRNALPGFASDSSSDEEESA